MVIRARALTAFVGGCLSGFSAPAIAAGFECDTPQAHQSHWEQEAPGHAFAITGKVRLIEARSEEQWPPLASVGLDWDNDQHEAGLAFVVQPRRPDQIVVGAVFDGVPTSSRSFDLNQEVEFEIRVSGTASGFQIAGVGLGMHLNEGLMPNRVRFACASGNFIFRDLEIRRIDD